MHGYDFSAVKSSYIPRPPSDELWLSRLLADLALSLPESAEAQLKVVQTGTAHGLT